MLANPRPTQRRLTGPDKALRRARIFARIREGCSYADIAREERLTPERIRQIVRQALDERPADDGVDHARIQLARLAPAVRLAGQAVEDGHIRAIGPLIRALLSLDRYQRAARPAEAAGRRGLFDRLRAAANLGGARGAKKTRDSSPGAA